jgi:hypothetical protein
VAQLAGLVLLVFGLLPIANWIPGGHSAPAYGDRLAGWIWGAAIALLVGVLAAILTRRVPRLWPTGVWTRIAGRWRGAGRRADALIAGAVFVVCAVVAQVVFSAKPLLMDEIISLYQARILASGRLWLPAPPYPEFTSAMHLLDWGGKVYGQFPVGGPAMLAIGTVFHAEWLVGPVATAIGVFLFARLVRRIELRDGTALAALLLYSFAPFTVFLGGSMMNHVTETAWLLGAALALAVATIDGEARPRAAFAMGLAFGIAAAIRPTDAAAFAIPAAVWLLWRTRLGRGHVRALVLSGIGVAIPLVVLFYVNLQQTGHPLRFGYVEMWGKSHGLGFHAAPWGVAHTPLRGIQLINLYLLRLQDYFLESAGPSLMFASLALCLAPRRRGFDRWVLSASGLLLVAYFAYWHDGFYLGPRFVLPLAPWLALWTARLPAMLEERHFSGTVVRGTVAAGVTALLLGAVTGVPLRASQYRLGMLSMRFDVPRLAQEHGVHDAVVLVRESWGAQILARMWGLGVSRTDAERIYVTTDACRMQTAIIATEQDRGDATELKRRLAAEPSDSARLVAVRSMPDTSARFVPGRPLTNLCLRRLTEDQAGFTLYPPFMLVRGDGNVYLRDLHARDSLVLAAYAGRPVWLVTKAPAVDSPLRFERVSVDSMRHEWALDQPVPP